MLMRALVSLLLLIPSVGTTGAISPQGVWVGTIGTRAITACFNKGSRYGSYYYVNYLKPISLNTTDADSFWHEGGDTGWWELADPTNGVVAGNWRNPKTLGSLPISLRIVDGNDDEKACARDSYNSRLETTPKVEAGKIIYFSPGRSYRKLRFAGQETIELLGTDTTTSKINSLLALDQSNDAIHSYFQQRRKFLGDVGYPAVDERLAEPTYWDTNFITIRFYLWIAGEGRSGISNTYQTWDMKTGQEVDIWQWIGASSSEPRLPSRLKKLLYRNIKVSTECANGYRGQGIFTLTLAKSGLNLNEDAWGDGCEESFFVPYVKLLPFLSPIGKRAVNSILNRK